MYLHLNPNADLNICAFKPDSIPFFVGVQLADFHCYLWQEDATEALAMLRQALDNDSAFGKRFASNRVNSDIVTLRFRESVTVFMHNDYAIRVADALAKALEQA